MGKYGRDLDLPKAPVYDFEAGKLTADDFVLRGYKLNDYFVNDPNNDWKHQGMLFGSTFIGYNEYGVSVDKKNLINRVLLNIYTPTRRGIAMGILNTYCSLYMVCLLVLLNLQQMRARLLYMNIKIQRQATHICSLP